MSKLQGIEPLLHKSPLSAAEYALLREYAVRRRVLPLMRGPFEPPLYTAQPHSEACEEYADAQVLGWK
mgnify:FL=1